VVEALRYNDITLPVALRAWGGNCLEFYLAVSAFVNFFMISNTQALYVLHTGYRPGFCPLKRKCFVIS